MEAAIEKSKRTVQLPPRKIFKTPRLLLADAYTIGSNDYESPRAREKSVYYVTFRRELHAINPDLYNRGDNRIVFYGLPRILERLFYEPITHEEIDEALLFLEHAKVTLNGYENFQCPEKIWRRVVDEFNGRPPILIEAMPEGSIVYPNEPVIQISSLVDGMGILAAWFESNILKVWATSERATQDRHWLNYLINLTSEIDPKNPQILLDASSLMTDFGDRAGMTQQESEDIPMAGLLSFAGTDTFTGAYQAWKNSDHTPGVGISVNALAHRNVQAFEFEGDCYREIYDKSGDNEFISMVSDCYAFKPAIEKYLLPLALESAKTGNGKIVIGRPDSGDAIEQVIWLCRLAVQNGLYTEREIVDKYGIKKLWKFGTTLKFIEGDSMDFRTMRIILRALMAEGLAPYGWGLFGVGGSLRNNLRRDNFSAKYAINSVSNLDTGIVKFSEVIAKGSLPGPLKLLRTPEALDLCKTTVFKNEPGENALQPYFNGLNIWKPFGLIQEENFIDAKNRLNEQFDTMPKNLGTADTSRGLFPASEMVLNRRLELLELYAPQNLEPVA